MTGLSIRRVRPADAERVRGLHRVAISDAGTEPGELPDTSDLDDLLGHYVEPGGEFLVGEREEVVVAMGGIRPVDPGVAEIKRMRVDPEYQGRGFGRAILEELEAVARERAFDRVVAETARRQDSAGFYRANGYRETGRRTWNGFELIELEKRL